MDTEFSVRSLLFDGRCFSSAFPIFSQHLVGSTASEAQHLPKRSGITVEICLFARCWSSMTIQQFERSFANSLRARGILRYVGRPRMARMPSKKQKCFSPLL